MKQLDATTNPVIDKDKYAEEVRILEINLMEIGHGKMEAQAKTIYQDFLGNTSTYQYDNFGRQSGIVTSDGSQTATTFSWHDPGIELLLSRYSVETTGNDGSQKISWYDKLGRVVRSDVNGFDGTMIHTSSNYNIRGLVVNVSEPYFEGATPVWNSYAYDDFGRQSNLTRPSGRNTSWSYAVNTITETTAGKPFTKNYAENGTMTSATDNGGTINYTYFIHYHKMKIRSFSKMIVPITIYLKLH